MTLIFDIGFLDVVNVEVSISIVRSNEVIHSETLRSINDSNNMRLLTLEHFGPLIERSCPELTLGSRVGSARKGF